MRNNENKKAAAPAAKLIPEQNQILQLVNQHGYSYDKLCIVLGFIGKAEIEDFVSDMDIHIAHYLASADEITGSDLTAIYKLFSFNRSLAHISGKL